ncbi:MAG: hypothetical protein ABMA01_13830 [Chthoniobacteraceae bacterium]
MTFAITEHTLNTARHTTGYLACGAEAAPLLVFVHGWPELSLSWRHQLPAFAAQTKSAPTYRALADKGLLRKDYLNGDTGGGGVCYWTSREVAEAWYTPAAKRLSASR